MIKRKDRTAQNLARKRWANVSAAERKAIGTALSLAAAAARTAAAKARREAEQTDPSERSVA
jgi:hypothetical protein